MKSSQLLIALSFLLCGARLGVAEQPRLERIKYNHPGLVVDLGAGLWAWPLPMDFDKDGDLDLLVSCPDKPFNGIYFYENRQGNVKMPVFEPPVRISKGAHNVQLSHVNGKPRVLSPGVEHREFFERGIETGVRLPVTEQRIYIGKGKTRAKVWKYVDYDGDGPVDLIVGYGDWGDYGWDDAYNSEGAWTNGPLHGYVRWMRNEGSNKTPKYGAAQYVMAAGKKVDVFGWPSPNFEDFDGDGDLDLLCGEFLDSFNYFENVGSRSAPRYSAGRKLMRGDEVLKMDLQMIVPSAIDWDRDGDMDLICGDEDGRVAFVEHTGVTRSGMPVFEKPVYFQQRANELKFGALATPFGVDWDGDGDQDIICGNTAGYIGFFENLGGAEPKWNRVQLLKAAGKTIRIMAGTNGSIQGPAEAKWGYTTQTVADWDHDGLPDLLVNSIWGKVIWYRNGGSRKKPRLEAARPITIAWKGKTPKPAWNWWDPKGRNFVTQWRTTPMAVDWNADGLTDIVMLDHEGYLALFQRQKRGERLLLLPGKRIFVEESGALFRPNPRRAGGSGRRKLQIVDWDGDGRMDILFNSVNADFYRNLGQRDGKVVLENLGALNARKISGHTSSPTVVDWDGNGVPDLLVGAEDGRFYYARNPRADSVNTLPPSARR